MIPSSFLGATTRVMRWTPTTGDGSQQLLEDELNSILFHNDGRFGCGHPPTPALDSTFGIAGFRDGGYRIGDRSLALQRRKNVESKVQPDRRS